MTCRYEPDRSNFKVRMNGREGREMVVKMLISGREKMEGEVSRGSSGRIH